MTRLDVLLLSLSQLIVASIMVATVVLLAVMAVQAHRRGMARVRRAAERERLARLTWLPDPLPSRSVAAQLAALGLATRLAADSLQRPYREAFARLAAVIASGEALAQPQVIARRPRGWWLP